MASSAEIPQRAAATVTATDPANASATQVLQVCTVLGAAQIIMGRRVTCTATVLLCVAAMVDAGQMQPVIAMKDTTEKLALSSAMPSGRALAEDSATPTADVSVRRTSTETTAVYSAQLARAAMHLTAAATRKVHVNVLDISSAQTVVCVRSTFMDRSARLTATNPLVITAVAFLATVDRAVGTVGATTRASASATTTIVASFAMFAVTDFTARRASFIAVIRWLSV